MLIGKTEKRHFIEAFDEYAKRIAKYTRFEVQVIPEPKNTRATPPEVQLQKEADALLQNVHATDDLILLDEHGKTFTSNGFARFIEKKTLAGTKTICFVIGGPYGFAPQVRARANSTMSMSAMTFPHQLARVVFAEQLYRALTIIKGEPYHHQ